MDPSRQYAYRTILYIAITYELRSGAPIVPWWNLATLRRSRQIIAYNQALADCFHNVAEFSRRDFEQFNENDFWQTYASFKKRFPHGYDYRKRFDDEITRYDPNNR